jgi:hypothetical protein
VDSFGNRLIFWAMVGRVARDGVGYWDRLMYVTGQEYCGVSKEGQLDISVSFRSWRRQQGRRILEYRQGFTVRILFPLLSFRSVLLVANSRMGSLLDVPRRPSSSFIIILVFGSPLLYCRNAILELKGPEFTASGRKPVVPSWSASLE